MQKQWEAYSYYEFFEHRNDVLNLSSKIVIWDWSLNIKISIGEKFSGTYEPSCCFSKEDEWKIRQMVLWLSR